MGGLKSYLDKDRLNSAFLVQGLPLEASSSVDIQKLVLKMSSDDEEGVDLPRLYKKAANSKRAVIWVKKEFENALRALTEASSGPYFFDKLIKVQTTYKEKRNAVLNIYDTIEDEVSPEKFNQDF